MVYSSYSVIYNNMFVEIGRVVTKQNMSSGFQKSEIQTSLLSYRDLLKIEILFVAILDIILSIKRKTKALIRLRVCAGWSAPLLFANTRRQAFSRPGLCICECSFSKLICYKSKLYLRYLDKQMKQHLFI